MKTSAVLSSLLFGSLAVAAPFDRRALVYKTEVVTETVVVFTTVYEDDVVPVATTTPAGYFYEQPKAPSSAAAKPTSAQAPVNSPPAAEKKPTSVYVAPPVAPTPTPTPAPAPAPAPSPSPAPVVEQPKPAEQPKPVEQAQPATSAYVAPAPAAPSPSPVAQVKPTTGGTSTGEQYSSVDMTIYDNNGGFGACGTKLYDTDMIVALAQPAWGASTYDTMTGAATNPWCGQKIKVDYNGNSIEATIMDLCPGCSGHDIDLSLAAWTKLTGLTEKTRLKASWSKIS
ncbi:hypothetical protein BKA63DRAFT_559643 [Paraphoma chrysanthemicola]|nr:hypothetical protein BKA63DRAFT_559643 [Paraphoma chrysanthemicola]